MQILGLLGMYFDAAEVFVKKSSLLFRLALAILCSETESEKSEGNSRKDFNPLCTRYSFTLCSTLGDKINFLFGKV